jgi:hypothetical protein
MSNYKDFSKFQYKDIPEDCMSAGDIILCQTVDYLDPFEDWDYAVGLKTNKGACILGEFKEVQNAAVFARALK